MVSSEGLKILVLDDDIPFLESFSELLIQDGHLVYPATRGMEALEIVRSTPIIDLSFLDCDLPDLDGIETFARIQWQRPELPAIFISGNPSAKLEKRILEVGGLALIRKPFDNQYLRGMISEAIYRKQDPSDRQEGDLRWQN